MCVNNFGWAVKKWSKSHVLYFFGNDLTKKTKKKCARGKLVGVE